MKWYHYAVLTFFLLLCCTNINVSVNNGFSFHVQMSEGFKANVIKVQEQVFNSASRFFKTVLDEIVNAVEN